MEKDKRVLKLYLIAVSITSAVVAAVWIYFGEQASNAGISALYMYIPFAVAFILSKKFYKKQNILGFRFCKPIYIVLAIVIPLAYIGISYILFWVAAPGSYTGDFNIFLEFASAYTQRTGASVIVISLIIMFISSMVTAFGEEAGWRGFMYPVMHKLWGRNEALMISGAIWTVWHLPVLLAGLYMSGAVIWYRVPMFIIMVFAANTIASWLRIKSGSVWPAVIWHASHNYFDQYILSTLTKDVDSVNKAYFVSETGFITVLLASVIAAFLLIRWKEKE